MPTEKLIPVCVYCDTTPWYTEADLLVDNLCDILIPESLLHAYFDSFEYIGDGDMTYEEWLNEFTADDTNDLYDFVVAHGFHPANPNDRKENDNA